MRQPVEITQASAVYLAKCRLKEIANSKETSIFKKMAILSVVKDGGQIDEIGDILYGMGLKLTVDQNNVQHQDWLKRNVVIRDEE